MQPFWNKLWSKPPKGEECICFVRCLTCFAVPVMFYGYGYVVSECHKGLINSNYYIVIYTCWSLSGCIPSWWNNLCVYICIVCNSNVLAVTLHIFCILPSIFVGWNLYPFCEASGICPDIYCQLVFHMFWGFTKRQGVRNWGAGGPRPPIFLGFI